MAKMSRANKIPWWLLSIGGGGQDANSPLTGAPSLRAMRRASKDPAEVERRLDELFDGSQRVTFYPVHAGVKPRDLIRGADARGYDRQPAEYLGEWALEVYTLRNQQTAE